MNFFRQKHKWSKWEHVMFYESSSVYYELLVRKCEVVGMTEYKSVKVAAYGGVTFLMRIEEWHKNNGQQTTISIQEVM